MNNSLNLRLDFDNDVRSFEFQRILNDYSIQPNIKLRTAVALNYRFISVKIGYSPRFLAKNDYELKGKTKVFNIEFDFFISDWMQTFQYRNVKGYYTQQIEDPQFFMSYMEDEYIKLPELRTLYIGGTTRYRFNENFSYKAVVNQNEIQLKSTGSFVPSLNYGYAEITDKTFPKDMKTISVILTTGYFYTFVFSKHWYSNLGINPGVGIEFHKTITRLDDKVTNTRHNNLGFNLGSHIGLGYNSKKVYGGFLLIGNAYTRDEKSLVKYENVRGYFKIFIGYRFRAPKSFEKGMDWVDNKNPFKKK